jgi:UrcA family protein
MAQTLTSTPHESVSASVSLADLDITTVEGTRAAQDRLKAMAQRLCRKFWDERKVSASDTYVECTRDTLASALAQLKVTAPALQLAKETARPSVHSD